MHFALLTAISLWDEAMEKAEANRKKLAEIEAEKEQARAAFEVTVNHLLNAGIRGETDYLTGVAENIIVGQPVHLGTGAVSAVYKPKKKAKGRK